MDFIRESENDTLEAVIAMYGEKLVYYKYLSSEGRLTAPQPMTAKAFKDIFKFVNDVDVNSIYSFKGGIIPKNVLLYKTDDKRIVWFTPKGQRQLIYGAKLPLETGLYPVPALVWSLNNTSLSVFAVTEQPDNQDAKLYNAPFFNVYTDGRICMGSAKYTSQSNFYEDIMQKAESGFYNSVFTHTNHNELVKGNFTEIQKSLLKASKDFPDELLVGSSNTLKQLLK